MASCAESSEQTGEKSQASVYQEQSIRTQIGLSVIFLVLADTVMQQNGSGLLIVIHIVL